MTRLALGQRHGNGARHGGGHRIRIIGIDQQGAFLELRRRTGKARQDQHAGIIGILGGDIFLGHQIHAVAQRRHQPDLCRAIKPRQRRPAIGAVDIAHRRPGGIGVSAIDAPRHGAHGLLDLGIFLDLAAALGRDLQVSDLAMAFGMKGQKPLIGFQPQADALGIIQPVHADHQRARHAFSDFLHQLAALRPPRQAVEFARLDPHRKSADAHDAVAGA